VEVDNTFAYQNGGASNPRCLNDTRCLLCANYESTRTPHLYSLRDAPAKIPARLFTVVSQQPGECTVGATGSRIFGYAAERGEHAGTNIKAVVNLRVQIYISHYVLGTKQLKPTHVDAGTFEC